MKKIIIAFGLIASVTAAAAQIDRWVLSEVPIGNTTAGYIYHTEANGVQIGMSPSNVVSGLRLICSAGNTESIISVYWQSMTGYQTETLTVKVDGKEVTTGVAARWKKEGQILFRPLNESRELLQAMRTGRTISMSWKGADNVQRNVAFPLAAFNSGFPEFNRKCGTNL